MPTFLVTRYMPPIIPIPGLFFIDFIRAYQFVENIRNRHRIDEDSLRQERIRLSREQWEGLVRARPDR